MSKKIRQQPLMDTSLPGDKELSAAVEAFEGAKGHAASARETQQKKHEDLMLAMEAYGRSEFQHDGRKYFRKTRESIGSIKIPKRPVADMTTPTREKLERQHRKNAAAADAGRSKVAERAAGKVAEQDSDRCKKCRRVPGVTKTEDGVLEWGRGRDRQLCAECVAESEMRA